MQVFNHWFNLNKLLSLHRAQRISLQTIQRLGQELALSDDSSDLMNLADLELWNDENKYTTWNIERELKLIAYRQLL